ncbi:hypothetical protein SAMD00019534_087600 [Acytostelium subglobosum LB1]|uniref:hypothetical protein n=1 Tax=Acytostelium subglobosum LB1 TaxID=1410327 RepID=UPI0006448681|nr:hypothetical protein SAMD00019534_087600 [Acytostelium subglobosum LB1]GAM25585.1 hypothetical protein SAMD00019534_087600 [Acytostelium subglobosum LB1]|eukprot:XP_012751571.1 hypothetical protein SAMD00019534_087600 [Acytostelium subglobosum LB1]
MLKDIPDNIVWITKPWALPLLQTLVLRKILGLDRRWEKGLIREAIKLNLIIIIQLFIDSNCLIHDADNVSELIKFGCQFGSSTEMLDMLLSSIPPPKGIDDRPEWLIEALILAAKNGHLGMLKMIQSNILDINYIMVLQSIKAALEHGHLDALNHLFNLMDDITSPSPAIAGCDQYRIDITNIHPSILSVDMLNRLKAHPHLNCMLDNVLGKDILVASVEVINMMMSESPTNIPLTIDLKYAIQQAAIVGDMISINRIVERCPVLLPSIDDLEHLVDHSATPDDMIIPLFSNRQYLEYPSKLLMKAVATRSLALVKSIFEEQCQVFSDPRSEEFIYEISTKSFRTMIRTSIKRDDIEMMGYVLKVAMSKGATKNKKGNQRHSLGDLVKLKYCSLTILHHLFDNGYVSVDTFHQLKISRLQQTTTITIYYPICSKMAIYQYTID